MELRDAVNYRDPLDVLRRFIPTPHRAKYRIGPIEVVVETNDFGLLPSIPSQQGAGDPVEGTLEWKLVRDHDVDGGLDEPVFFTSGTLTVVRMGSACLLGLDHERRELLGFLGDSVDSRTFQDFLVPFLCGLSAEVVNGDMIAYFPELEDGSFDA